MKKTKSDSFAENDMIMRDYIILELQKQHIELACKYDALITVLLEDNNSITEERLSEKIKLIKSTPEIKNALKSINHQLKSISELKSAADEIMNS